MPYLYLFLYVSFQKVLAEFGHCYDCSIDIQGTLVGVNRMMGRPTDDVTVGDVRLTSSPQLGLKRPLAWKWESGTYITRNSPACWLKRKSNGRVDFMSLYVNFLSLYSSVYHSRPLTTLTWTMAL